MKPNRILVLGFIALATTLLGCSRIGKRELRDAARLTAGGDARAGRTAIRKYGCYTCHTIEGVTGARGKVGPPLNDIAERAYIAGEVPNTPDNLMRWIQHPHVIEPNTVMPEMNVTEQDSRDIAAYLYLAR